MLSSLIDGCMVQQQTTLLKGFVSFHMRCLQQQLLPDEAATYAVKGSLNTQPCGVVESLQYSIFTAESHLM